MSPRSAAPSRASTPTWRRCSTRPGRSGAITPLPSSGFGTGIAGINRRADAVIALVQSIKADTANILASVLKIEASAKSIEGKIDQLTSPVRFSLVW